ncbi:condensation domain-containing protein [Actinospica robiniae]|uniref:condensation domain-containing protein n=1 Tax=Actinospica robiniae TaxID=304901 RepID=UPI00041384B9|nr:condensation domain-containing protein [Actinospica robiniae]
MAVARSTISIRFQGAGSGAGELTWGQVELWDAIVRTGRTFNIGGALPMPPGTTAADVAVMLRFWICRHPSLRTRLRFEPDEASAGSPRRPVRPLQEVAAAGEVALHVVDVDAEDDPAAAAEELRVEFEVPAFDYANEWPVRMGVVCRDGEVTHMVVQYCHLAVDGGGIDAMVADLESLDRTSGLETAPPNGITPLELARSQSTPAGRRASDKSLRHWANALRGVPARRFGHAGEGCEPRFWELYCYSPAMHLALQRIADRTETNTTHVLFAAYAVALARVTGVNPSLAQTIVSNRFRPGLGPLVGAVSQPGLCVVEVADKTFDEVVALAWKAVTAGALHGYYRPDGRNELLDRLSEEHDEPFDISCFVNDRRREAELEPGRPLPSEEQVQAALKQSMFRWERKESTFSGSLFLQVDSGPDLTAPERITPEQLAVPAVYLEVWADTRYLPPDDMETFARTMEEITVQAAFDPAVATGVHAGS